MTQWTKEDLYGENTIDADKYCKNCRHYYMTPSDNPFYSVNFCFRKGREMWPLHNCEHYIRRSDR